MRGKCIARRIILICVFFVLLTAGLFVAETFHPAGVLPDALADDPGFIPDATPTPALPPPPSLPPSAPAAQAPVVTELAVVAAPVQPTAPPETVSLGLCLKALPVRMRIPALSLDYKIQGTGADKNGNMQIVPALAVVSWFELSAIPGNNGNAILGGHNTWAGSRSRLFTLDGLQIGDAMEIDYDDGTSRTFMLESVFVYALKTAPADLIMDVRGAARVTLITCKWPFNTVTGTSDNRIVAVFKEESVFVVPDPPIEPFPPKTVE